MTLLFVLHTTTGCYPPSCVSEGTLVTTPTGSVLVEDLRVGDLVLSVDPALGKTMSARVVAIRSAMDRCISFESGAGRRLIVTRSHLVYSPESGGFVRPESWLGGASRSFLVYEGGRLQRCALRSWGEQAVRCRVFDLTVDSPPATFLANGFLVHNKSNPRRCVATVDSLVFGSVTVGDSVDASYEIMNVGQYEVRGTVALSCPAFSLVSGSGAYRLGQGQSRAIVVRFKPDSPGAYNCRIYSDGLCPSIVGHGRGVQ